MTIHYDEARSATIQYLTVFAQTNSEISRVLIIDDMYGLIRVALWLKPESQNSMALKAEINTKLQAIAGSFWTGDFWFPKEGAKSDQIIYEDAWKEARTIEDTETCRITDRYRNRAGWFSDIQPPVWALSNSNDDVPVITFYSFKGGLGRTTALAAFAMERTRNGESVAIVDLDLDAPGVGSLLAPNIEELPKWGVVDYLLERAILEPDLRDFYFRSYQEKVSGSADLVVFPAGQVDSGYLGKLARIDLEPSIPGQESALTQLLKTIRIELKPKWILIDARPGLSNPAGILLSGLAHMHVLFGTNSDQSWQGLKIILDRLGQQRVLQNKIQAECVLVQAMVPDNTEIAKIAKARFAERSVDEFSTHYYLNDTDAEDVDKDEFWTLEDIESQDAPHVPVPIHYSQRLAFFNNIAEVADYMIQNEDYKLLSQRITSRFSRGAE